MIFLMDFVRLLTIFWLVLFFQVIIPLPNQVLLFYFCNLFYYSQTFFKINCVCLVC
jgi:hypothetical protein